MFCRKCGNKIELHDKFCKNCGEPVTFESEDPTAIVPEPPKDLVWNIEGFPKDKKVEEVIFDWKADNQGDDFHVDNFYVDDRKNISAQRQLDKEIEKINSNSLAREEAILKARADSHPLEEHAEEENKMVVSEGDELLVTEETRQEPKEESIPFSPAAKEENIPVATAVKEEHTNIPNKTELKYDDIFAGDDEDEQEKGTGFSLGKFVLFLIILLIILEGAFLGLRYFIPENPTVKMINEKVTQAVLSVGEWFSDKEPVAAEPTEEIPATDQQKSEEPAKEEPVIEEPENPYPENINIKDVSQNPDLVYASGKNYGNGDINNSLPVTESTDGIIKAVVAYDSKWIDYVNNGDKSVLTLTAPGSQAEKNTLSFTKVGQIRETFTSLQIGEVRKGSNGYYVWVREEIQIEENGTNAAKVYNWIYQVAPIENEMKIVNYFSYK